jgi:hypothetical protein
MTSTTKPFQTLSVPLPSIISTKFEQPLLGSNYLLLDIKPSPDGGLTDGTKVEIRIKDTALFSFVSVLEKTREKAVYMKKQAALDEADDLRTHPSFSNSCVLLIEIVSALYTSPVGPGPSAARGELTNMMAVANATPPPPPPDAPPGYDA